MSIIKLESLLDKKHALYELANRLNWDYLIKELGSYYAEGSGRPEIPYSGPRI
jgi:IS5 family transposase